MPKISRGEKLNMLLRDELGKIIDREIEFSENTLVTITRIVSSPDLRYATVFLSVLNGDEAEALEMLKKNVYHIQQQLNRALRMRPVPKIRFVIDEEELRRESVERSLAELKQKGDL
ncbi:MAG: 30S ribosome-binding factor RbfA [bacterium]|nr:30S ribosome-binding factor RbfA [bacterium]